MHPMRAKSVFAGIILIGGWALAGLAFGQYVWLDENGRKQYSDLPPPPSVAPGRILKTPRGAPSPAPAPSPASAASGAEAGGAGKAKAPPTLADKNAEFVKRRTEREEQEQKEAEERRAADQKAKNCDRARLYQKTLESGVRVIDAGKNGERVVLDQAQREQEERATRDFLKTCD